MNSYSTAKEQYAALGVDTDQALDTLRNVSLSIHCWQGDDVSGFEAPDSELSGGGIMVTGNHPGRARSLAELRQDLELVYSLLPGRHRANLHAIYGDFGDQRVDRDAITPAHFQSWIDWARENGLGLDFNATCFSHPRANSGFTLSDPDRGVRDFWIEHVKRCREISAVMGRGVGRPSVHNLWIPDGSKDYPADRLAYRERLKHSLDTIFQAPQDRAEMKDALETKLFGIGSEAYVVGSHEFYLNYAARNNVMVCFDLGHFHPTESVADKVSSVYPFTDELLLHVSRPMRWDSDHVVVLNDDIFSLCREIVRAGRLDTTYLALDFFDATINRIGAWAIGARATLKGLLAALLEPTDRLRRYEQEGKLFERLALLEELKTMPLGAVWEHYLNTHNVVSDRGLTAAVATYETDVLSKRDN